MQQGRGCTELCSRPCLPARPTASRSSTCSLWLPEQKKAWHGRHWWHRSPFYTPWQAAAGLLSCLDGATHRAGSTGGNEDGGIFLHPLCFHQLAALARFIPATCRGSCRRPTCFSVDWGVPHLELTRGTAFHSASSSVPSDLHHIFFCFSARWSYWIDEGFGKESGFAGKAGFQ